MKLKRKILSAGILAALCAPLAMTAGTAQAEGFSGNAAVVSKYIFRGGEENNNAAVQGGFDWESSFGLYAGYWGSSLGYGNADSSNGFENDLYVGYGGEAGAFSWGVQALYYGYLNVDDADVPEVSASVGFMGFGLGAAYAVSNASWTNSGDTYLTASYEAELPANLGFEAVLGYYIYDKGDSTKLTTGPTTASGNFNSLSLSLSHPIADTGASASFGVIIGGKDRTDADLADQIVLGVNYGFDI